MIIDTCDHCIQETEAGDYNLRLPSQYIKNQESQGRIARPSLKQNRKEITSLAEKWRLNHYTVFYRQYSALSVMFQTLNLVSNTSETRHGEGHLYSQHSYVEARGSEVYHLWLHNEFDLIYMRPYPCPNPPPSSREKKNKEKKFFLSPVF